MYVRWHSKKGDTSKSGGAIRIRMCEYNFKNEIWGHFSNKGGKKKKNLSLYGKMLYSGI